MLPCLLDRQAGPCHFKVKNLEYRRARDAVENGVRMACDTGILAGYPLVDLAITLQDAAMVEGETTEADFAYAASEALWNGARDAGPSLLEPVMIVILGGVIGGIVISMYMPMFTLISKIG